MPNNTEQLPELYVSYAWNNADKSGPDREAIVNEIQTAVINADINFVRDKTNGCDYSTSIRKFEHDIGRAKAVAVVLSEKYFASEHCMYELAHLAVQYDWNEKVSLVVLPDAKIFDRDFRDKWQDHWHDKLAEQQKYVDGRGDRCIQLEKDRLTGMQLIVDKYGDAISVLADANAKTPALLRENGFRDIIERVKGKTKKEVSDKKTAIVPNVQEIINLIENNQIEDALLHAKGIDFKGMDKSIFKMKSEAYLLGLEGQQLINWQRQMKVFLMNYL